MTPKLCRCGAPRKIIQKGNNAGKQRTYCGKCESAMSAASKRRAKALKDAASAVVLTAPVEPVVPVVPVVPVKPPVVPVKPPVAPVKPPVAPVVPVKQPFVWGGLVPQTNVVGMKALATKKLASSRDGAAALEICRAECEANKGCGMFVWYNPNFGSSTCSLGSPSDANLRRSNDSRRTLRVLQQRNT